MSTDEARRLAYVHAFDQLRSASNDAADFDDAFARALDALSERFPDEVPTAIETLMAYAASLGHASGKHLIGFV
ncbi:hypothetical protein H8Z72_23255 (plasmid) [Xanthomonas citri pv. citri]|uniref:hypothetical protein n=1 Tax=Xanthomonas citri TaxID=346 RepID=UPI0019312B7B|nr:hypothetical protein [Xanthomonas citri]QRD62768.1 hypothetical protein H8Z74_22930 [Xanthomonas citri pv. citri]QRD67095.1 hypothetical protein H8Z73_23015 [Xanthomonas citri pv. citri]QRD71652.1 hypothetical protein H8Z72_23255 [Xanthomonas citri pv. citri]